MTQYVISSFVCFWWWRYCKNDKIKPTPFLFDNKSVTKASVFEVYFTIPTDEKQKIYNYGFSVTGQGVEEEWLNCKSRTAREYKLVFYRNTIDDELDLSGIPKSKRENIKVSLEQQTLIVSLGAKLKIDKCKIIRDWFGLNSLSNFADPVESLFRL